MKINKFGEMIFDETDLCDLIMKGYEPLNMKIIVDPKLDIEAVATVLQDPEQLIEWTFPYDSDHTVPDYDAMQQRQWFMPEQYQNIDIAEHVLNLCDTDAELQRCGHELMMYQERGLFELLKYLKYLVDTMHSNHLIWGVGRGSSVASYVLYKLGVHRIDSMFYDLDPGEFLR